MVDRAQDTLRPNNRLSDMQATMEQTQAFENRVLERLNAGKTVRSFLITAVELLTEAVNLLVLQVFRKDDYAVKYAVEPLLDGDGPLGDLSVRLKLIYGLGVINRREYEDAELLMALREELNHDGNEYAFTDDEILGPFGELHCVAALPPPPQFEPADSSLYAMQIQRYQQAVRSTMVLSLTELISKISLKKPFKSKQRLLTAPLPASADKADDNTPDVVDITARFHRVFRTESRYGEEVFSDTPGTPWLDAMKSTALSIRSGTFSPNLPMMISPYYPAPGIRGRQF